MEHGPCKNALIFSAASALLKHTRQRYELSKKNACATVILIKYKALPLLLYLLERLSFSLGVFFTKNPFVTLLHPGMVAVSTQEQYYTVCDGDADDDDEWCKLTE